MTMQIMRHIVPETGAHALVPLFLPVLILILCIFAGTARAAEQRSQTAPQAAPQPVHQPTSQADAPQSQPVAWLSGIVTYRERMALPPDAVLVIRLCRRADQARPLVAELRLPVDGKNVPLPFRIAVPDASCAGGCDVRAEIVDGDGPIFASDTLALPEEAGRDLTILTSRVMPEAEADDPASTPGEETLTGVRWRLAELFGQPARVFADQPEPHLIFLPEGAGKGRIGGSDGCNRILGRYEREGDAVRFLDLGATMMLCPDGAEQASAYAKALREANAWRLTEHRLKLYQGDRLLAVFAPVAL